MSILGYPLGWIMWAIYKVVNNYGVALILFTVLVRLALFPLSVKQQKSSAKMQVFQPKMQEIQKKYANNKEKQQEEMMKLYEQHGYNPMAGCLPSIIQMILLFGIIYVVYEPLSHILHMDKATITALTDIVKANAELLGTSGQPQLTAISAIQNPETVGLFSSISSDVISQIQGFDYTLFGLYLGQIPTWKSVLVLIPILSGVTALLSSIIMQKMQSKSNPSAAQMQGSMKTMLYLMPLMSVYLGFILPAALCVYWIANNLFTMVQEIFLTWYMDKYHPLPKEEPKKKKKKQPKQEEG